MHACSTWPRTVDSARLTVAAICGTDWPSANSRTMRDSAGVKRSAAARTLSWCPGSSSGGRMLLPLGGGGGGCLGPSSWTPRQRHSIRPVGRWDRIWSGVGTGAHRFGGRGCDAVMIAQFRIHANRREDAPAHEGEFRSVVSGSSQTVADQPLAPAASLPVPTATLRCRLDLAHESR